MDPELATSCGVKRTAVPIDKVPEFGGAEGFHNRSTHREDVGSIARVRGCRALTSVAEKEEQRVTHPVRYIARVFFWMVARPRGGLGFRKW